MFKNYKQQTGDIIDSNVVLINGDVTIDGQIYSEIRDIFIDTLHRDFEVFSKQASQKAMEELETCLEKILRKLVNEQQTSLIENFKLPAIQVSLHDTLIGYIITEDEYMKDFIVDILMDRLKVQGNNLEMSIVNDAIKIIPNLTLSAACLIALLSLRQRMTICYSFMLESFFSQLSPIINNLGNVSKLDIEYLKQINCIIPITGIFPIETYENHLLKHYDLFFRQKGSLDRFNSFAENHPEIRERVNDLGSCCICLMGKDSDKWQFLNINSKIFYDELMQRQQKYLIPLVEELKENMPIFSEQQVREYLVTINPAWSNAFELLNSDSLRNWNSSILGNYIGNKVICKYTHAPSLPFSSFSNPLVL